MSEWKEYKLGEIVDYKKGFAFQSSTYQKTGVPVVRVSDTTENSINMSSCHCVNDDIAEKCKDYKLLKNDIIIATVGSWSDNPNSIVGKVVRVPQSANNSLLNQNAVRLRNKIIINSDMLYYKLKDRAFSDYLLNVAQGSASQASITLKDIFEYTVTLPPFVEQGRIAGILSSLDDKIDLLNLQNQTLESMSGALFRHYFIDNPKEEWKDGVISDLIDFNPTRKLTKNTVAPFLEMSELSTRTYAPNGWYERAYTSGTKFQNGDTLLARITPCLENGKTAYVDFLKKDQVGWGSTEYIVMRPKEILHPFFAYVIAKLQDFRDFAESCMSGSSGRQRVDVENLKSYEIQIPDSENIKHFNVFAESTVSKMNNNNQQIHTLTKLRDTLLPMLMSAEVKI